MNVITAMRAVNYGYIFIVSGNWKEYKKYGMAGTPCEGSFARANGGTIET